MQRGEREGPVVLVEDGGGLGDKGGDLLCWYNVDDMLDDNGTGGEKDQSNQLGAVEEEGNGGGVGVRAV